MKAVKVFVLSTALAAGSAFAIDFNWANHDPVETFSYTHRSTQGVFADDARFIVTNGQSNTMRVDARLNVTAGSFSSLVIEIWGDYYGPDKMLASFGPNEDFSFPLLSMRKKYFYLIRGQAAPGPVAGWTLTSRLVPK
jgi:hypothetical protein